jgi:DNA-binding NtrC family response regulator
VRQWGVQLEAIEPDAMDRLRAYEWPGNIRQLRNAIERAALVAPLRALRVQDLPAYVRDSEPAVQRQRSGPAPAGTHAASTDPPVPDGGLKPALRAYEVKLFQQALRSTGGNRAATAKLLRIPIRTLFRRLNELGVNDSGSAPASNE